MSLSFLDRMGHNPPRRGMVWVRTPQARLNPEAETQMLQRLIRCDSLSGTYAFDDSSGKHQYHCPQEGT